MEFKNVSYSPNSIKVLKNISVNLDKLGITTIIGPNGAGKTTLLNLMFKIITANNGIITLDKKNIEEINKEDFLRKVSYLRNYGNFFHDISVEYFLKLNRFLVTNLLVKDDYLKKIIDIFSIEKFLKRQINTLSSGERQRIMIASIFLLESEYILLDEPFSFLDISAKIKMISTFKKYFSNKKIIMVSHDFFLLKESNHIIALKNGEIALNSKTISDKEFKNIFSINNYNEKII